MKAVTLALAGLLSGCYVTRQALHQNDLFNTRRPVAAVIADPETDEKTRIALSAVERILKYAQAEGLNAQGAYKYYIATKEPVVSYIVQAAYADKLEFVTWWFPVVGDVPYLGFFRQPERDAKAQELAAAGYDVHESGAGAFSSLGWFDDPVFSSMLTHSEADLAHLFFHELTHRTLWVPGSTEFNENLAEYVAGVLAPNYLKDSGKSELVARYSDKRRDKELFRNWLLALKAALTDVYAQGGAVPRADILRHKQETLARFVKGEAKPRFKAVDYVEGETWNNAAVLGAALYAPDEARFDKAYRCIQPASVKAFLAALKDRSAATPEPFAALDSMCHPVP